MLSRSGAILIRCGLAVLCAVPLPAALAATPGQTPLDAAAARAWLNRFGYGADRASLAATVGQTPQHLLQQAIHGPVHYPPALAAVLAASPAAQPLSVLWQLYGPGGSEKMNQPARRQPEQSEVVRSQREVDGRELLQAAVADRLLQSANSDNPGHEVLLNFWLNHFSIHGLKTINQFLAADYVRTLQAALREDSFLALLEASFYHPAMQVYLDNIRSTAPDSRMAERAARRGETLGINENLARELLELHTLGVDGGYRQADVQALARIITGAGILNNRLPPARVEAAGAERRGYFFFDPARHDFGAKRLLGVDYPAGRGSEEIRVALRQLAQHPATGRHLAGKLARRFLSDEPPPALVAAMAAAFQRSGGRISATLQPLLDSPEFARSLQAPGKFKEPLDYLLSAARAACDGQPMANGRFFWRAAQELGQAPLLRSTPDGYGSQEADWLSSAALAKRVRLAQDLASGRLPLAQMPEGGNRRAAVCVPQAAAVRAAVGPLSATSSAALAGLDGSDEIAALLASPEFMRR